MRAELHLPDLPEVPIAVQVPTLGAATVPSPRARVPWHLRLREAVSAYLPLLLMLLLALATWWLVKETPPPPPPAAERPPRSEPDYTMRQFALERFDAAGQLVLRIEGEALHHYPDTDRVEVERATIRALAADGRLTLATAARALGNGDGSELQLLGGAEVTSTTADGQPLRMTSEFLHAFLVTERVRTHLPVQVSVGASRVSAGGLDYDHAARRLELKGPLKAVLPARATRSGGAGAAPASAAPPR
jgi:lipopolysaccharide export system protein LptC